MIVGAAISPDLEAQTTLYAGGGASFPTGDYGEYANTGWQVAGGVVFPISDTGLAVGVEASYASNERTSDAQGITYDSPFGLVASVRYGFTTLGSVEPYVSGGAGLHYMGTRGGDGTPEIAFGYQLGAGLGFELSPSAAIFAEGRYSANTNLGFLGVLGGLAFTLGGG
jgi:opacity protein-like surface antigen